MDLLVGGGWWLVALSKPSLLGGGGFQRTVCQLVDLSVASGSGEGALIEKVKELQAFVVVLFLRFSSKKS